MKGVVSRVFEKQFGNKMLYSIKLQGDETFYRLGENKPGFVEKGVSVEFEVESRGINSLVRNIRPWVGEGVVDAQAAKAGFVAGAPTSAMYRKAVLSPINAKDDYWQRREERDVETQKRIELQSCRNSAIALVAQLLSAGAIKLPTKQADQADVIFEAVEMYTKKYLEANAGSQPEPKAEDVDVTENNNEEVWN